MFRLLLQRCREQGEGVRQAGLSSHLLWDGNPRPMLGLFLTHHILICLRCQNKKMELELTGRQNAAGTQTVHGVHSNILLGI